MSELERLRRLEEGQLELLKLLSEVKECLGRVDERLKNQISAREEQEKHQDECFADNDRDHAEMWAEINKLKLWQKGVVSAIVVLGVIGTVLLDHFGVFANIFGG